MQIKAIDDFELDVLGIPWGSPDDLDSDRQYFSPDTKLHEDKFGLPPIVHYHGIDPNTHQPTDPEYIGKAISFEDRPDGRWYRVVLDKAKDTARRVWEAARQGIAVASSGSNHLARVAADGFIAEWPVLELSLWPNTGSNPQAHPRAIAIPAKYKLASIPAVSSGHIKTNEENMNEQQEDKAPAVDLGPVLDAIGSISDQVKAFGARVEALETKPTNDPGIAGKSANIITDTEHWKYDNLSPGDLALGIDVLRQGVRLGKSRRGVSDAMVKALAMRLDSDDRKSNDGYVEAYGLMRHATKGMKANEIAQSTLANYGDEWVGVAYGTQIWESIRTGTPILERQMAYAVPQPAGAETLVFPLEGADPTWYLMPQASALGANPGGIPTNTATSSKVGTGKQDRTMAKVAARVLWTGELEEDSVVNVVSEYRRQLAESGMEMLESLIIDGDTETGATTNINDIAGTPGGTEYWLGLNGYRKLALITNTANARDAGTLTEEDFLETVKLMGVGGKNAMQKDRTAFILDLHTYWKSLTIPSVKTRDVNSAATVESGNLIRIWGYDVLPTENMHAPSAGSGYELKTNAAGKIDQDTAGNNTKGAILAVRFDQWRPGYRRQMTLESTRIAAADATEIIAIVRFGMVYRDTEASAISYNVTV